MNRLDPVEKTQMKESVPDIQPGDTVRVHVRIKESETKERIQIFEGLVIARKGGGVRETITVRKVSFGVGVERIFPLHSPRYEKIEVLTRGDVNRSRLFYLRDLRGKASRVNTQEETMEGAAGAPPATARPAGQTTEEPPTTGELPGVAPGKAEKPAKKAKK